MVEVKFDKNGFEKFKNVIGYLSNTFLEVAFDFQDRQGLNIMEIEQSNVMCVGVKFKPEFFSAIKLDKEKKEDVNLKYRLNIQNLKKVLGRCSGDVSMKFGDEVEIVSGKKNFRLAVIESYGEKDFKMPNLTDSKVNFKVELKKIKEILLDSLVIKGDSLVFDIKNKRVTAQTDTYSNNKYEGGFEIDATGEAKSGFGTDFLSKVFINTPFKEATLFFGTNYPLRVVFEDDNVNATVVLAPRVENT